MPVSIDNVYQKVLVLANKEQRGYITPQEFNLMADRAQRDIYESYFNMDKRKLFSNKTRIDDELDGLEVKLSEFYTSGTETVYGTSDSNYYGDGVNMPFKVDDSGKVNKIDTITNADNNLGTELTNKEVAYTENNPLTKATKNRPVYVRKSDLRAWYYPVLTTNVTLTINYWKRLSATAPSWGYVVVNDKALYNSNTSVDFELHISEEEALVTRILELAGLVIRSEEVAQAAMVDKANTIKFQND